MPLPNQPYGTPPSPSETGAQKQSASYGTYRPASASIAAPQQNTAKAPRKAENLILNILLYVAALFVVGSAALFITSVAYPLARVILLSIGTLVFYGAGLATYRWVPKLRLASYSFAATGVALIPLTGLASYTLLWDNGPAVWAITSIIGTILVLVGAAIMQERVMAYLIITFLVSDVLASSKILQLSLIWYFAGLLVLATVLALCTRFSLKVLPEKLQRGFLDSSRVFVPVTMIAALVCSHRMSNFELAALFFLATLYCFAFMRRPLEMSLYIQCRIYSALAVLFLVSNIKLGSYWVFLPAFAIATLLLISSIAITLFVKDGFLPWSASKDALITWGVALFASVIAYSSLAAKNNAYSVTSDSILNLSWLLPQDEQGHFLFPAWILPLLFIASVALFIRKVPQTALYAMLAIAAAVPTLILWKQGGSLMLIAGGIALFTFAGQLGRRRSAEQFLGLFFALSGVIFAILQTISLDASWVYLALALFVALAALAIVFAQEKSVHDGKAVSAQFNLVLAWSSAFLVSVFLLAFSMASGPVFEDLYPFEFKLNSLVITLVVALIVALTAGVPIILLKQVAGSEYLFQLQIIYGIWTVLASAVFTGLANTVSDLLFLIFQLGIASAAWYFYRHRFGTFFSIATRLIFLYLSVCLIWALEDKAPWDSIITILVLLGFSSASLLLFKQRKQISEEIFGLVMLGLSTIGLIYCLVSALPQRGLMLIGLLLGLITLAVSTAWLLLANTTSSRVVHSLVMPLSFALTVDFIFEEFQTDHQLRLDVFAWVLFLGLVICKVLSLYLPPASHSVNFDSASRRLDSQRFSSLVLPGLWAYAIYLLIYNWWLHDISAALLILGVFALFAAEAKPSLRVAIAVAGVVCAVLRALFALEDLPWFFLIIETVVLILAAQGIAKALKSDTTVDRALHWWAFGLQVWSTFMVVFGVSDQPVLKRVILLFVTVVLLAAVALAKNTAGTIATAILITAQVLWTSIGFNPITLFIFGVALLALVIWRLLARKDDEQDSQPVSANPSSPTSPKAADVAVENQAAAKAPWAQPTAQHQNEQSVVGHQKLSTDAVPPSAEAVPAEEPGRNPWDPPAGAEIRPWSTNQ